MKKEIKQTSYTMTRRITYLCICMGIGIIVFSINLWQTENDIHDMFNLERYGFHKNKAPSSSEVLLKTKSSSSLRKNENAKQDNTIMSSTTSKEITDHSDVDVIPSIVATSNPKSQSLQKQKEQSQKESQQKKKNEEEKYSFKQSKAAKVSKPILVVGLPKAGTTSIYEYFKCGGYKTSHWRCRKHEELCGALIRENVEANLPPLQNTGGYDVYAQLDGDCYFPQIYALEEIHEHYPEATLILNQRNITSWIHSMRTFQAGYYEILPQYKHQTLCDISEKHSTDEEYIDYYNNQVDRIYDFVKKYPSHLLIDVHIEDDDIGSIMESYFGISSDKCWGIANKDQKEIGGKNKKKDSDENNQQLQLSDHNQQSTTSVKNPILVVGLPKSGTTTIYEYFKCGGYKASHWRCGGPENDLCGAVIRDNVKNNKPPLENINNYDVYAQLDGDCYFPQIDAMEEIHKYYPDSTLILNMRDAESWLNSVNNFVPGPGAYMEKYGGMPHACSNRTHKEMIIHYNDHIEFIRNFVKKYPSHKLIEFYLEDEIYSGKIMEDAFGVPADKCWGMANVNENIHNEISLMESNEQSNSNNDNNKPQVMSNVPKVTKPTLVVGMPKGGTTTLSDYFTCGGQRVSHWRCGGQNELCGALIRENVKNNRPPLENTGGYDVYAQLDGDCYFPQIVALNEIHNAYPEATFILNLRDAESWVKSVNNFKPGAGASIEKYGGMPHPCTNHTDNDQVANYNKHTQRIRDFVTAHPSHKLVEFHLEDENAGNVMEDAFGINANKCWGMANVNENIHNQQGNNNHDNKPQVINNVPKMSKPILIVGMPKGGTTALAEYFTCGKQRVSHWRCGGKNELCGALIRENVKNNRPPLENTGGYDVYAQLDGDCYFPQIVALEEIHSAYPDATLVLNLRNATSWVKSVNNFEPGAGAYIPKYGMPHPCTNHTNTDKVATYKKHTDRIHQFVAKYPSHRLVEFYLEDENAGNIMESAFGISAKECWGKANVNENIHHRY